MSLVEKSIDAVLPEVVSRLELEYPDRLVEPAAWVGHIPFAMWLIGAANPRLVVELGVHTGNSYCAFLQAVQTLGLETRCFGVDHWQGDAHAGHYGDEVYDDLRSYHDSRYGTFSTLLRTPFEAALPYFSDSSVDLLHIDGFHTYEAVSSDFASWLPKLSSRGVVLLHDTNVRERGFGIWKFWEEIAARYPHFEFVHCHGLGIVYVGSEPLSGPLKALFAGTADKQRNDLQSYFARLGMSLVERLASKTLAARFQQSTSLQRQANVETGANVNTSRHLEVRQSKLVAENTSIRLDRAAIHLKLVVLRREQLTLSSLLAERERELAETAKALAKRDQENITLTRDLAAIQRAIAELKDDSAESVKDKEAERAKIQTLKDSLELQLEARSQELASVAAAMRAVHGSLSWKLTRPFRVLKRVIPRLSKLLRRAKVAIAPPAEVEEVKAAFDRAYYLGKYPDIEASGVDPFNHFMSLGWKEGRDPSADFCTRYYLRRAPDVAAGGQNPFVHWVLYGRREKRASLPYRRRLTGDYVPKVSAIVPNFNHARFLTQRIESILAQTYPNVEILILDDCSSDESLAVIGAYCEKYPERIRAIANDINSGNVFKQWRKGIDNTDGTIVWICESDDFCEPDFLEKLVPHFRDNSVNLAFGRIQETDREGNAGKGLDDYREGAEAGIWQDVLIRPAREWFANGFGVNNVIANVGGSLWRRSKIPESIWREAQTFSVVGDWFLYYHIAGGGQIAWEPEAVSYFRQHGTNTSASSFTGPSFYRELERFMLGLRRQWDVPDATVEKFYDKIAAQYSWFGLNEKLGDLQNYCDKHKLLAEQRSRAHILIAFYGFIPGGGEFFPLNLANFLHAEGWLVSMLAFETGSVNADMRAALDPAIPVYDSAWVEEYGADRFIVDAGISLIHSHNIGSEFSFFENWKIQTNIPYLVTLHGSYEVSDLTSEQTARLAAKVSHFVYTANRNLESLRSVALPQSRLTKLPNAMPADALPFPKTREDLGIVSDAIVFTLVARGIPRKGWGTSISAFIRLREKHPERAMHLLLCGDGDVPDKHRAIHGNDPGITFLGYQSRISGLYRISDVAIVPTRFQGESFPLCIIQAFQSGTPVIASRVGEIESMVTPPGRKPAGLLIESVPDNEIFARSLGDAMEVMLSRTHRHEYAAAAKMLGEGYSMDRLVNTYGDLYKTMLAETGYGVLEAGSVGKNASMAI